MKRLDIPVGSTYGRLTVLGEGTSVRGKRRILCQCSCGTKKEVRLGLLRKGEAVSCGCFRRDSSTSHGLGHTEEYRAWHRMVQRASMREDCEVYEGWQEDPREFVKYITDLGWEAGLCVCRNGDTGNYEPGNIRIDTKASNTEEALAKYYTLIDPEGLSVPVYNLRKFCRENNLSRSTLYQVKIGNRDHHKGWRWI